MPKGTYLEFIVPSGKEVKGFVAYSIENTGIIPPNRVRIIISPGNPASEHVLYPGGWGAPLEAGLYATEVTRPTLLSDIIKPNMGLCVFTGCRCRIPIPRMKK